MKKTLLFTFVLLTTSCLPLNAEFGGAGASSDWGKIQKRIFIQKGLLIPAWQDRFTYSGEMEPVGDGTYRVKFDLIPGNNYNFALFAISTHPIPGITTGYTYYDPVPNSGTDIAFITSTTTDNPLQNNTRTAKYTSIFYENSWHGRRVVWIPDWLADGTTYYVYCNWASTPNAPTNFRARPFPGRVELTWGPPYGYWGTDSEAYKAIDVIVGGAYHIYRSSISAEGPYEIVATTPGYSFSWTDTNVTNGVRYYYAIVSSDTYRGDPYGTLADVNLFTPLPLAAQIESTPGETINIRFRVEGIDWEKVKQKDYLVWLTPITCSPPVGDSFSGLLSPPEEAREDFAKYSSKYKIPARIVKVKVPKTLKDRINDIIKFFGG